MNSGASDREVQQALIDISINHGLTQVHNQWTRGNNMLDLVFTNNHTLVKCSNSVPGISDHCMVVTDIGLVPQYKRQKRRKYYLFSKADREAMHRGTSCLSSEIVDSVASGNVEDLWNTFKTGIHTLVDKRIPSKMSSGRKSVLWLNSRLKRMVRQKKRQHSRAKKSGKWDAYRHFQKQFKKAFKSAEIEYINDSIQMGLEENNT